MDRVRNHEAALVLFRISATVDGKQVAGMRRGDSNKLLRIYLAGLDDLDAPKRVFPAAPSESTADEGWRYLVLSPGLHYLLILPPGGEQNPPAVAYDSSSARYGRLTQYEFTPGRGGFYSPELGAFVFGKSRPPDFQELQGFWVQVPTSAQVVYLGSVSVACKNGRGLFGSLIDSCSDFELADDEPRAREVVASSLPGLDVATLALVANGKPRTAVHVPDFARVTVTARAAPELAAEFTGAELSPSGTIVGTGPAVAIYNLLAMGGRMLGQAAEERRAEKRAADIQPCISRLAETVSGSGLVADFGSSLVAAPRSPAAGQDRAPADAVVQAGHDQSARYRLLVSVPIMQLRQSGSPQDLALELGMDVRLEDADSGRLDYYSMLLYAPDLPMQSPLSRRSPLYSRIVAERARPHPITEWCGDGGPALLAAEISTALKQIAAQVAVDLD